MGERRRRRCADHLSGHILGGVAGGVAVVQSDTKEEPTALAFSCPAMPSTCTVPPLVPSYLSVSPNIGPSSCDDGGWVHVKRVVGEG